MVRTAFYPIYTVFALDFKNSFEEMLQKKAGTSGHQVNLQKKTHLPAWRNNHTGVRSTFSPLAARNIRSFCSGNSRLTLLIQSSVWGKESLESVCPTIGFKTKAFDAPSIA